MADTVRAGTYAILLITDKGGLNGELTVRPNDSGMKAEITVGAHSPPVKSFSRKADAYVLVAGEEGFAAVYTLRFVADSVHGSFNLSSGVTGSVEGVRKP